MNEVMFITSQNLSLDWLLAPQHKASHPGSAGVLACL